MDIKVTGEYIQLQQAMQLCGACGSGSEAKYEIVNGNVTVNGEVEVRRGKKLRDGDTFSFCGEEYRIVIQ